jgi:hypothetical protein
MVWWLLCVAAALVPALQRLYNLTINRETETRIFNSTKHKLKDYELNCIASVSFGNKPVVRIDYYQITKLKGQSLVQLKGSLAIIDCDSF